MGWLITRGATKADIVSELTAETAHRRTVGKSLRGNVLFQVVEIKATGAKFIEVDLLRGDRGFGWGYKDVDETMGPYQLDCPLYLLELADPPSNDWAKQWRDNVRAHHAQKRDLARMARAKAKALPAGSAVRITDGITCRGVKLKGGKVAYWKGNSAICYTNVGLVRLKANHVEGITNDAK